MDIDHDLVEAAIDTVVIATRHDTHARYLAAALRAGDSANGFKGIVNDGRFIGLVVLDGILQTGVNNPGAYGLTNWTQPVCVVPLPDCDNVAADLKPNGNAQTWLWASELWIGPTAHQNLGNFANGRATGNPF